MMNVMGEGGIKNGKNGWCNRFTDPNNKVARSKINIVFTNKYHKVVTHHSILWSDIESLAYLIV